jgi:hypothetical protein
MAATRRPLAGVRTLTAIACCGWLSTATAGGAEPDAEAAVDFAVLTPAMEGRFIVGSGFDPLTLLPPHLALGQMGDGARAGQLRALVARERYQPERTIADRLVEALGHASYRAVHQPIRRKPAGTVQSLSWDEVPERPRGELVLDLTVRWICLCSEATFAKHYPGISINWRLLDPARTVVVLPTRTLTYVHLPEKPGSAKKRPRAKPPAGDPTPAPPYPVEKVSESCGFDSVKAAAAKPDVLWGCLGEAYDAALRRLVIDLQKLHSPRAVAPPPAGP